MKMSVRTAEPPLPRNFVLIVTPSLVSLAGMITTGGPRHLHAAKTSFIRRLIFRAFEDSGCMPEQIAGRITCGTDSQRAMPHCCVGMNM